MTGYKTNGADDFEENGEDVEINDVKNLPIEQVRSELLRLKGRVPNMPPSLRNTIDATKRQTNLKWNENSSLNTFLVRKLRIPRRIHVIWLGGDKVVPTLCIESWKQKHPDWEFNLWTELDLNSKSWINYDQMRVLQKIRHWAGLADLMRYEILYRYGGVYVDADAFCLRAIDSWLLENEIFACWDKLPSGTGIISNSFIGSVPRNVFIKNVILEISKKTRIASRSKRIARLMFWIGAFRNMGPVLFTRCIRNVKKNGNNDILILPSEFFYNHTAFESYPENISRAYAIHTWANTLNLYSEIPQNQENHLIKSKYVDDGEINKEIEAKRMEIIQRSGVKMEACIDKKFVLTLLERRQAIA